MTFSTLAIFVFFQTLSPLQSLLRKFSWLWRSVQAYVPSCNDATDEIFDLQRDLHVNEFAFLGRMLIGDSNAFLCLSVLVPERVGLRSSSCLLLTLQTFCVGALAVGMRICLTQLKNSVKSSGGIS